MIEIKPVKASVVLAALGSTVSKSTLMKMVELGGILPFENPSGRGSTKLYSFINIVQAGIWKDLRPYRLERSSLFSIMREYAEFAEKPSDVKQLNRLHVFIQDSPLGQCIATFREGEELEAIPGIDTKYGYPTHLSINIHAVTSRLEFYFRTNHPELIL